jgi:hypothetical protein
LDRDQHITLHELLVAHANMKRGVFATPQQVTSMPVQHGSQFQ